MVSETTVRIQTYVVVAVIIGCFSILYPRIFHPLMMNLLGLSKKVDDSATVENDAIAAHRTQRRPHPTIRYPDSSISTTSAKRGGVMAIVLPVYAIGVVLYLVYTLSKIYGSKRRRDKEKKEKFLQHYYRDFHYDVQQGKFRMGRESSDECSDNEVSAPAYSNKSGNKQGRFDWSASYSGTDSQMHGFPNIYRSAESLPRDLEQFLTQMNNPDAVKTGELSALRERLETTEREMSALLRVMDSCEQMVKQGEFTKDRSETDEAAATKSTQAAKTSADEVDTPPS